MSYFAFFAYYLTNDVFAFFGVNLSLECHDNANYVFSARFPTLRRHFSPREDTPRTSRCPSTSNSSPCTP